MITYPYLALNISKLNDAGKITQDLAVFLSF